MARRKANRKQAKSESPAVVGPSEFDPLDHAAERFTEEAIRKSEMFKSAKNTVKSKAKKMADELKGVKF